MLRDFFVSVLEAKWRWIILLFSAGFSISWFLFAIIWYLIAYFHGDLEVINKSSIKFKVQ